MTVSNLTITGNGVTVPFGLNEDSQYTRSAASTGGGGWQIVDRPRKYVSTEWVDCGQWQLTLNLILDSMYGQTPSSIEGQIGTVEAWEIPAPGSNPPEPPKLTVAGPVPHTEVQWVLYTNTWGNAIRDPQSGVRWQQECQMVLWEYLPPQLTVTSSSPAKNSQQASVSSTPGATTYTARSGDTLQTVAARQLGDWTAWSKIAALNGIRDPATLGAGQVLQLPSR